jgi:hypothetical protein
VLVVFGQSPLAHPLLIEQRRRDEGRGNHFLAIHARQKRKKLNVSAGGVMRSPKLFKRLALLGNILDSGVLQRLHADVDCQPLENSRRKHVRVRLPLGALALMHSGRRPKHQIALFRVDKGHFALFLDEEKVELLLVLDKVEPHVLHFRKALAKLLAVLVRVENNLLQKSQSQYIFIIMLIIIMLIIIMM